jgi:cytochrome P450
LTIQETTARIPVIDADMTAWEFNQDPYPVMEQWRALGPVVFNTRYDQYLVTSYRNCAKALADIEHFNSQGLVEFFESHFGGITMEALDSQRHHQMRGVWADDFQRDSLQAQRQLVAEVVADSVDPFVAGVRSGRTLDAVAHMARGIPTMVIARMLAIEPEMYEQFARWTEAMGRMAEGRLDESPRGRELLAESESGTRALNEYIADTVARRRRDGRGPDLVSKMVHCEFAADMEEREIVASNTQLVFAGSETTTKLIAATLVAFAEHPDQLQAVIEDRSLIPQAVEEVHRWRSVTQSVPRHACSDESAIAGVLIPRGARVELLTGAANRDPQRWQNAQDFDIFRPVKQHLGFGFGMHVCLGLNLTRLELHVWLDRWLDKLPDYRLPEPVDYGRNFPIRGPVEVPVSAH